MRIRHFSNVFYVEFCDRIDPECNSRVLALDRALVVRQPGWLLEAVPSYGTLAVFADSAAPAAIVARELTSLASSAVPASPARQGRLHLLQVRYGGEYGPDLDFVARKAGITEDEVVRIHTSKEYFCYMLGFTPGFAYLGNLDDRIVAPRLETPRLKVPAGSVGIAGNQTGFYGVESPGGWRIIGRLQTST